MLLRDAGITVLPCSRPGDLIAVLSVAILAGAVVLLLGGLSVLLEIREKHPYIVGFGVPLVIVYLLFARCESNWSSAAAERSGATKAVPR